MILRTLRALVGQSLDRPVVVRSPSELAGHSAMVVSRTPFHEGTVEEVGICDSWELQTLAIIYS